MTVFVGGVNNRTKSPWQLSAFFMQTMLPKTVHLELFYIHYKGWSESVLWLKMKTNKGKVSWILKPEKSKVYLLQPGLLPLTVLHFTEVYYCFIKIIQIFKLCFKCGVFRGKNFHPLVFLRIFFHIKMQSLYYSFG